MSQAGYSAAVTAHPIRAIIIQPDSTYEITNFKQDPGSVQAVVGEHIESVTTERCTLWCDEESELKDYPCNLAATYLWWSLTPEMEGKDVLQGTVLVTGPANEAMESDPVPDDVISLMATIGRIVREHRAVPPKKNGTTGTTD